MSDRQPYDLGWVLNEAYVPPLLRQSIKVMGAWALGEIERQEVLARSGKFGGIHVLPGGPDHARLAVLLEELGEVARELNEQLMTLEPHRRKLQAELIQVAACAIAWAAAIEEGRA